MDLIIPILSTVLGIASLVLIILTVHLCIKAQDKITSASKNSQWLAYVSLSSVFAICLIIVAISLSGKIESQGVSDIVRSSLCIISVLLFILGVGTYRKIRRQNMFFAKPDESSQRILKEVEDILNK